MLNAIVFLQAARQWNLDLAQDIHSLLDEAKAPDPDVCAQDLIDFSPVYRCLHIHTVLVRPFVLYPCCVMSLTICRGRGSSSLITIAVGDAVKYGWPSSLVVYGYASALCVGVICYMAFCLLTPRREKSTISSAISMALWGRLGCGVCCMIWLNMFWQVFCGGGHNTAHHS